MCRMERVSAVAVGEGMRNGETCKDMVIEGFGGFEECQVG